MSNVLIADDHAVVRAGYRTILKAAGVVEDFGEACNGAQILEQLRMRAWSLILLDVHLPDRSGIDIAREVRRAFPETSVLIVSGLPEDQYAIEALRAGAAGYLSKECAPSELVSAVRGVLNGLPYISSKLAQQMAENIGKPNLPPHEQLSERERQVFHRLAMGSTITAIAREFKLSVKTISTYRTRILDKMSLKTNNDVTSYAFRHGLAVTDRVVSTSRDGQFTLPSEARDDARDRRSFDREAPPT